MPSFDMPLEDLKKYLGSNIKTNDFELYWKKQKERIDKLSLDFKIKKKFFKNKNAEYFELEFTALDGAKIYAKYIRPKNIKNCPLVFEFHDYKEASRGWHYLTRYIGIGYAVIAMDARGQGGKSLDSIKSKGNIAYGHLIKGIEAELNNLYYVNLYLDSYMISKLAESLENIDINKMICFGKGQGGAQAIVVSALNEKIRKCSAQYVFLADFKRVWDIDLDENFYEGIRCYFRWFDPMHLREKEFFDKLAYIDVVNFANSVKCEVLLGTGLLDKICPPSTQFALYNNLQCKKRHLIFHKYGHEINNFFENENLKFMEFE
ncbi:MAG: acetylxylan esterase [Sarcina sp.]